jgi:hypothetical protein
MLKRFALFLFVFAISSACTVNTNMHAKLNASLGSKMLDK